MITIPKLALAGEFTTVPSMLADAARDFGGIVLRPPQALLRPAHARDVATVIRFAREHGLTVCARGQAHSVLGQAQADIVIDARSLAAIRSVGDDGALVEAGATWRELLARTTAAGLTPPVLADYLDLSIGGVLSVGGIGGATHRHGLVADSCVELEVVTGAGEIVCCSERQHPRLFRAVLGGLGQCAIIVQARIKLTQAQPLARVYQLSYRDLHGFVRDQRAMCEDDRFDFITGQARPTSDRAYAYIVQAARWYAADDPPDDASALSGLMPAAAEVHELSYADYAARGDDGVERWKAAGLWNTPHPWWAVILNDAQVDELVARALREIAPAELGAGCGLLYPFKRSRLGRPLVRVPSSELLWLFGMLPVHRPADVSVDEILAKGRELYLRAAAEGGKRYAISAVQLTPDEQAAHFDEAWPDFVADKHHFDPDNILTPGQGIFPRAPRQGSGLRLTSM